MFHIFSKYGTGHGLEKTLTYFIVTILFLTSKKSVIFFFSFWLCFSLSLFFSVWWVLHLSVGTLSSLQPLDLVQVQFNLFKSFHLLDKNNEKEKLTQTLSNCSIILPDLHNYCSNVYLSEMKTYTWEKVELLNASSTASWYSSGITVAKIKFFIHN